MSAAEVQSQAVGTSGNTGMVASTESVTLERVVATQKPLERDSPSSIFTTVDIPTQSTEETSSEASSKRDSSVGSPNAATETPKNNPCLMANENGNAQPDVVDMKAFREASAEHAQEDALETLGPRGSLLFSQDLGSAENGFRGSARTSSRGVAANLKSSVQPQFGGGREGAAAQATSAKASLLAPTVGKAASEQMVAASAANLFGKSPLASTPLDALLPSPASLLASRSPAGCAGLTLGGSSFTPGEARATANGFLLGGPVAEASALAGDSLGSSLQVAASPVQTGETSPPALPSAEQLLASGALSALPLQLTPQQQQLLLLPGRGQIDLTVESARETQEMQLLLQLLLRQQKQTLAATAAPSAAAQGRAPETPALPAGVLDSRLTSQELLSLSPQLLQDLVQKQCEKQALLDQQQQSQQQPLLAVPSQPQTAFSLTGTEGTGGVGNSQLAKLQQQHAPLLLDAQISQHQQRLPSSSCLAGPSEMANVQCFFAGKKIVSDCDASAHPPPGLTAGAPSSCEASAISREVQLALLQHQLQTLQLQAEPLQQSQLSQQLMAPQQLVQTQPLSPQQTALAAAVPLCAVPATCSGGDALCRSPAVLAAFKAITPSLVASLAGSGTDSMTSLLLTLPLNLPFGRIVKFGSSPPLGGAGAATAVRRSGGGSGHSLGVKKSYYYFSPSQHSSAHRFFSHAGGICDTFAASLQMELAILSVPTCLVSYVATTFARLGKILLPSLKEPLKLRCTGLQERIAPGRFGGRVLTVGCAIAEEQEKQKFEQLHNFLNHFEDAVETALRCYTKQIQQLQAQAGGRSKSTGASGKKKGQTTVIAFGRRHNIWRYNLGGTLPTAHCGEVTNLGSSGCLDLTIRAFDTRPLDRPLKDFSSYVVEGVCCSEIRLVTTKAIDGITTEIDPRFHPQSIGTRPILLGSDGSLCRHVFAPQVLPKVWAVCLGTSSSASREQQKKAVEECVVAHIENKSKADCERMLQTLEDMRVSVEEDGVPLTGKSTQTQQTNLIEFAPQASKQIATQSLASAPSEKSEGNGASLLEAPGMTQNLSSLVQGPQPQLVHADCPQQLSLRMGEGDAQQNQRLDRELSNQAPGALEQQHQQSQTAGRNGRSKSAKKNGVARASLGSSDTASLPPQPADTLLLPSALQSIEATLQACKLGVDPLAQHAASVRQALQQNSTYPCSQLSMGALQFQQLQQQLLYNVSPFVQEGTTGATGLKQQPVGIERSLGNNAEDLTASCILGRGVASAAALESISSLSLPQAQTPIDPWPVQQEPRTGLVALQKARDFAAGDQDVQQQVLDQQQRLLHPQHLQPRLAVQVQQQPADTLLSPQQKQTYLFQQQQKPQQDSFLVSPFQQRPGLCLSSPLQQQQHQNTEVTEQTIGNLASQMAQQQLQLQQLQLQQLQQLQQFQQFQHLQQQIFPNRRMQFPLH